MKKLLLLLLSVSCSQFSALAQNKRVDDTLGLENNFKYKKLQDVKEKAVKAIKDYKGEVTLEGLGLVQLQYDMEVHKIIDSLKFEQEKEIAEVKLQKQKAITYGGFAGIAITIVLLFFVYRNYNKQRIANKQLKEAQEQLIKSEKMAAFGTVASRLSHEILNPLNFVNNFSEISKELVTEINTTENAEDRKEASELLTDNLQKINEHGKRAADIVKQLQEMSSKGTAGEFFEDDEHLKFVNKTE